MDSGRFVESSNFNLTGNGRETGRDKGSDMKAFGPLMKRTHRRQWMVVGQKRIL